MSLHRLCNKQERFGLGDAPTGYLGQGGALVKSKRNVLHQKLSFPCGRVWSPGTRSESSYSERRRLDSVGCVHIFVSASSAIPATASLANPITCTGDLRVHYLGDASCRGFLNVHAFWEETILRTCPHAFRLSGGSASNRAAVLPWPICAHSERKLASAQILSSFCVLSAVGLTACICSPAEHGMVKAHKSKFREEFPLGKISKPSRFCLHLLSRLLLSRIVLACFLTSWACLSQSGERLRLPV